MASITVHLEARLRWWVRWYLAGVAMVAVVTGCQPDLDRVRQWILRGVVLRLVKK